MKKQIKYIILATLFVSLLLPEIASSQRWGGRWKPGFWDKWSVNVNGGLTSFFGDLSLYDTDIADKLSKESGPAFGVLLSKNINDKFAITGQILYGTLKGQNSTTVFNANILELNIQARVNFINLFSPDNLSNFDVYGYLGLGQFTFKSEQYKLEDPSDISIEDTGTPEFVYFFGFDKIMAVLTNDFNLREIAETYRWWVVILPVTTIAAFIWDGVFIGLTASKQMRNVMLISTFTLFFPAYFLSVGFMGNHSLWFAINFFMATRSLLMWKTSKTLIK